MSEEALLDLTEVSAGVLCEFLEVAFHLILYTRGVYPPVLFQRCRKYNVPVQMCTHPELNQYLRNVLEGVRELFERGAVDRLVLAILNKAHQPVERFTFKMSPPSTQAVRDDHHLLQLEEELRSVLLRLGVCEAELRPTPPNCTFSVLVHTSHQAAASMQHSDMAKEFPWVVADSEQHEAMPAATTVPIKSLRNSTLKMDVYVTEREAK